LKKCQGRGLFDGRFEMTGARRFFTAAACAAIVLALSASAGCGQGKGVISSVTPKKGLAGTGFKISGSSFGKAGDGSKVTVGGRKAKVVAWGDTSITAVVPGELKAGSHKVVVVNAGGKSNAAGYTVHPTYSGSTPLPAMASWLKSEGIDASGYEYSVVATSAIDPGWKLDKAAKAGSKTYYFLFHEKADGWTIVDVGERLTASQVKAAGAPADLKP